MAIEPEFAVRRSQRARRARLTITRDGQAVVVLPLAAPESVAVGLVARHQAWLERHRRRILAERAVLAARPALDEGRLIPLRGTDHRLVIEVLPRERRPRIEVRTGPPPVLWVGFPAGSATSVPRLLERWLRAEARADLQLAVDRRAADLAVTVARITVRDQRTRWASASRQGSLSFSWRLILCPPGVLDYVVVHELAHLRWRGHGPRFWALVRRHAPDAALHRLWLRERQAAIQAALD